MKSLPLFILTLGLALPLGAQTYGIIGSKHDLTASGSGTIKAATETEVCLFCHTPHRAGELPLWNHEMSTATYTPYLSSTLKATVGQPSGSSKLCLSCHDGTVALGMVHSRSAPIAMNNNVTTLPPGRSNLGTDLSDDHPISFVYDTALASANGELRDPTTLNNRVKLDHNQELQCTACHDPHDDRYGKFLVTDNRASALCTSCHDPKLWATASHKTSTKSWNGVGPDPWPHTEYTTVQDNACASCHRSHTAGTPERLLNHADEEQNCYVCHSGNVAAKNVAAEFSKLSTHPITATAGIHDPMEDAINPPRHVECVDCHNPHAATASAAPAPNAGGALAGVIGMNTSGSVVNPVVRDYELCFRCHADSAARGQARVNRQFVQTNTRLEFTSTSASYHPVTAAGKNGSVPSLLAPWTTSSLMKCGDCHNNDQGPGANGAGPNGPHGSSFVPLLERNLQLTDNSPESAANYALCYKCHSRTVVTGNQNNSWKHHKEHVVDAQTACTTCHDPHGVQNVTHLINFNRNYVTPGSNGRLEFVDQGLHRGNCSLTCHGKDHNALSY